MVCNFLEPSHYHRRRHIPSLRRCSIDGFTDGFTHQFRNRCNLLLDQSNDGGISFHNVTDEFQTNASRRSTLHSSLPHRGIFSGVKDHLQCLSLCLSTSFRGLAMPILVWESRGHIESLSLLCSNGNLDPTWISFHFRSKFEHNLFIIIWVIFFEPIHYFLHSIPIFP